MTLNEKFEKSTLSHSLFLQTVNSIQNNAVGTSKGFDELFAYQPAFENESRPYEIDRRNEYNINQLEKNEQFLDFDTTEIKFEFQTDKANEVRLALSCCQWKPNIILQRVANTNTFTKLVRVPKGTHYYRYVLDDGKWVLDPLSPMEKDLNGTSNNVINIYGTNIVFQDLKLIRRQVQIIRKNILAEYEREVLGLKRKLSIYNINTNSNE